MSSRYWLAKPPTACDLCKASITTKFFDARTKLRFWGCLCEKCWRGEGSPLGTGKGQQYELDADGHWEKTGG
jgi:hypothetical protein